MEEEPMEVWERRVEKILDDRLKPVKKRLKEQERVLKRMQFILANQIIFSAANHCRHSLLKEAPEEVSLFEKLTAKLTSVRGKIKNSPDPLSLAIDFQEWCTREEEKQGVEFVKIPIH